MDVKTEVLEGKKIDDKVARRDLTREVTEDLRRGRITYQQFEESLRILYADEKK